MKLVRHDWSRPIVFQENRVPVLCLENVGYFTRIVQELIQQRETGEGDFFLSEGDVVYELGKTTEIILSPFQLNFNDKRFQTSIVKRLLRIANDEEYLESQGIKAKVLEYLYQLTNRLELDVELDAELEIQSLIKLANPRPAVSEDSLEESLLDYCSLLKDALGTKLIVCVNLRGFFTRERLMSFYETIFLKKINLLTLDNAVGFDRIPCEDWLIVDEDLCEI